MTKQNAKNHIGQKDRDGNPLCDLSRLQHQIPKVGLFITWLPGLVLLTHFLVNGITPSVQANNLSSKDSKQEKKLLNNDVISAQEKLINTENTTDLNGKLLNDRIIDLDKKIDNKAEVLGGKIDVINGQQQNFLSNGQNTLNFLLTVIGGFTTYIFAKSVWLDEKEKENLRGKITQEVIEHIDNEKLEKLVEKRVEELQRNSYWLEYQIAFINAEQLKFISDDRSDKVYLCLAALYEYLRAIEILDKLREKVSVQEKFFLDNIDIIDRQVCLEIEGMAKNINDSAIILDETQKTRLHNKIKDIIEKRQDRQELLINKIKLKS